MWPNPQFLADLVTFTDDILHGKLYFLCSMSNIYLKVAIEKNWRFQNINFLKFKKIVPESLFGDQQLTQISANFETGV